MPLDEPTPQEVYTAAEACLPYLPSDLRDGVAALLAQARGGKNLKTAILALLAEDESARRWVRAALFGEQLSVRGYEPLPGNPTEIPANSRWVCPQCGFVWHVARRGRPVPHCPKDGSLLRHAP